MKVTLRRVRTVRLDPMQKEMYRRVCLGKDSNRRVQQELKVVVNVALQFKTLGEDGGLDSALDWPDIMEANSVLRESILTS